MFTQPRSTAAITKKKTGKAKIKVVKSSDIKQMLLSGGTRKRTEVRKHFVLITFV